MQAVYSLLVLIIGFIILIKAADVFCNTSIRIAYLIKLSPLFVSAIFIPIGTSAPELFVSSIAAIQGIPILATGNVLGSNIINISLGVGLAACIHAITVNKSVYKLELPIFIIATLCLGYFLLDLHISRFEGLVLMMGMLLSIVLIFWREKKYRRVATHLPEQPLVSNNKPYTIITNSIIFISMALLLYISSSMVVWGAQNLSITLGISELLVGLVIVAIGTSLPEITVSVLSIMKKNYDIALGNIIGSNNFNILFVLGTTGIIAPHDVPAKILERDYLIVFILSMLIAIFCYNKFWQKTSSISLKHGILLLVIYIFYIIWLLSTE